MRDCCPANRFSGSCEGRECQSAAVPLVAIERRITAKRRSYRIMEAATVVFYVVIAIGCGVTLDNHFKREAPIEQENVSYAKR